jgi:hypothetical protein
MQAAATEHTHTVSLTARTMKFANDVRDGLNLQEFVSKCKRQQKKHTHTVSLTARTMKFVNDVRDGLNLHTFVSKCKQ